MPNISIERPRHHARLIPAPRGLGASMILALGTFAVGTDAFVVTGFLPAMARTWHVSSSAAGQSVTIFAVAYALLAPIISTLTARCPRRGLLVAALGVLAAANLASALAPSFDVLLAARVAAAAGAAAYTPNAGAVAATLVPARLRARALAVVVGGLTLATAIGVPLGSAASQVLGWRAALLLVAAACLFSAVAVTVILPALPGAARVALRDRLAVLRHPPVLAVLALTVLGMAASYTVYAFSVPALRAVAVAAPSVTAMLFLYGVGAVIGNLASGYATDRWGPVVVLLTGYLTMAAGLGGLATLAGSHAHLVAAVAVFTFAWGASSWCQTPAQQHRLIAAAPEQAPLLVSLNSSGIYLGIALGTVLGGAVLSHGIAATDTLAAALAGLALMFLGVTTRQSARRGRGRAGNSGPEV